MTKQEIQATAEEIAKNLTYAEWNKISLIINRSFDIRKSDLEENLKITQEDVQNTIRGLFG